ncbi:hypothetical protein ACFQH6_00725 [Halobacteriaceae archaeon GCM10025711]
MVDKRPPSASVWDEPGTCPFCEDDLADPGAGFIDHIHANPDCESGFERWRSRIAGDITGEWAG